MKFLRKLGYGIEVTYSIRDVYVKPQARRSAWLRFRKRVHPNGVAKIAFPSPIRVFESPLGAALLVFHLSLFSILDYEGRTRVSPVECRRNEGGLFSFLSLSSPSSRPRENTSQTVLYLLSVPLDDPSVPMNV